MQGSWNRSDEPTKKISPPTGAPEASNICALMLLANPFTPTQQATKPPEGREAITGWN